MATLEINGRDVEVDDSFLSLTPEQQNATVDEIAASMGAQPESQGADPKATPVEGGYSAAPGWTQPITAFGRGVADIATSGFLDEMGAGARWLGGKVLPWQDEITYDKALSEVRQDDKVLADQNPVSTIAGQVTGALGIGTKLARHGLSPLGALPASAGLGARFGAGMLEGAAYGGAYGFGSGEGLSDRLSSAAGGTVAGGLIGGAVPVVAAGLKVATKPIRDAIKARTNPGQYAAEKIGERLSNSGMSINQAATRMERDGLSMADVGGKSTRNLLRTTTNIPGKAQDRVASQLTLRQMGQGDRLKGVVRDVFADPDGFITAGDKLAKAWSKVGDDVYEPALKRKVVWTDRLQQFIDEPIFKRGLAQGVKIQRLESLAAGKPFNPVDYAIKGFNEAGDPIISGIPNMRTLNVAKKGIDAIIGDMKNPLTGKLTEEGRATAMVQKAFIDQIDQWNPEYAKARQVWGGFAKVKEALEFGQKEALTISPEAVSKTFKAMSEPERQAARIGIAEAMRKKIDAAGYTQNAILRIFSNRRDVGVLKAAFPDTKSFGAFRKAIFAEAKKRATYEAVKGNSTTASQMMDLMETGGLKEGVEVGKTAVTQGMIPASLQWVGSRLRMLGGLTPEVADNIARKLMTANPESVRQLAGELTKIESSRLSAIERSNAVQSVITRALQVPAQYGVSQPR